MIGRSSARALANASCPHGYQSTGLSLCWRRWGLVAGASRFTVGTVPRAGGPLRCPPMAVLASYNVKGGVGKTATVVNLAHRAALAGAGEGARTLVFDLDPQGAASYYFRAAPKVRSRGKSLVRGKVDIREAITPTDFPDIDLIPSDFSFRNLDVVLDAAKDPGGSLARVVRPLTKRYDHVFL